MPSTILDEIARSGTSTYFYSPTEQSSSLEALESASLVLDLAIHLFSRITLLQPQSIFTHIFFLA